MFREKPKHTILYVMGLYYHRPVVVAAVVDVVVVA